MKLSFHDRHCQYFIELPQAIISGNNRITLLSTSSCHQTKPLSMYVGNYTHNGPKELGSATKNKKQARGQYDRNKSTHKVDCIADSTHLKTTLSSHQFQFTTAPKYDDNTTYNSTQHPNPQPGATKHTRRSRSITYL